MSARQELDSYVSQLEKRLRIGTLSRGAAILTSAALGTTIVLVLAANALAFSEGSLTGARLALFCALASAAIFGLVVPIARLSRRRAIGKAEEMFPQFQQRLVTFAEREDEDDPFLPLLAADALDVASGVEPAALAPNARVLALLGVGVASAAVLIWMIGATPGVLGYGARLLWTGSHGAAPLYDLRVTPGDATVRRNTDELITAQPLGILAPKVFLYARYQS